MTARYKLDYAAFGRLVLNSPAMEAEMRARAERVQAEFIATAPVSDQPDDEHRGRYKDSSSVESGTHGGIHHDRAYGRVTVDDEAAMSIEYGHHTKKGKFVEGSHTLTRALDAAGD